jgi:hypothetical protein
MYRLSVSIRSPLAHPALALLAPSGQPVYVRSMNKPQRVDPFVSNEPEVEVDATTHRILKQRMKTAEEGRLVSPKAARERIQRWLSESSTTKTR